MNRHRLAVPKLLVGTKVDLKGAEDNFAALEELYGDQFRYLAVSSTIGQNLDLFARAVFEVLQQSFCKFVAGLGS